MTALPSPPLAADPRDQSATQQFAAHMFARVQVDPRVAYYIGPASRSLELLVAAGAEIAEMPVDEFAKLMPLLRTERPRCGNCQCEDCRR